MWFESRYLWFPKDPALPDDYEDALAVSQSRRSIAIADGVSTAIFSRRWAELITTKAISEPISFTDELDTDSDRLRNWLEDLQKRWRSDVKPNSLPWHQKPKAVSIGAQTTLLSASLNDCSDQSDEASHEAGQLRSKLRVDAIGDCNLFLVREGKRIKSFPIQTSDAFSEPPNVISSITNPGASADHFQSLDMFCFEGDLLVFCSDAVGLWATRIYEQGEEVEWLKYWDNQIEWQEEICTARDRAPSDPMRMRVDDCTLLLLKIIKEKPERLDEDLSPQDAAAGFELLIKTEEEQKLTVSSEPVEGSKDEDSNNFAQEPTNAQLEDKNESQSKNDSESNRPEEFYPTAETGNLDESNSSSAPKTAQGYSEENDQIKSESGFPVIEEVKSSSNEKSEHTGLFRRQLIRIRSYLDKKREQ